MGRGEQDRAMRGIILQNVHRLLTFVRREWRESYGLQIDTYIHNVLLIGHDLSCEKGRMIRVRVRVSYFNERRRCTIAVLRSIGIINIIIVNSIPWYDTK